MLMSYYNIKNPVTVFSVTMAVGNNDNYNSMIVYYRVLVCTFQNFIFIQPYHLIFDHPSNGRHL